ncbi:unnamed protein product [Clavelina lepadiformis]|uniref:Dipeptidyl peptidase 4 n=1 Tax=Clavelina lepadiformis TaxID=159417 RepID=A0ABP0GK90_CLALP
MMSKAKILLLATTCIAVFALFLLISTPGSFSPKLVQWKKRDITSKTNEGKQWMQFDDFLNGKFRAKSFYPNWVSGNEYITTKSDGSLVKVNIETDDETEFLSSKNLPESYDWWLVSADQLFVAFGIDTIDGYAHYVRTCSVLFYNVPTGSPTVQPNFPSDGIQKFKWSPMGHKFVFISGFNVHLVTDPFASQATKITHNGDEHLMFNGISDWLFSVEITDDDALLWWSGDGSYLAFATINQTGVTQFEFSVYNHAQYPEMIQLPYPKPGTTIPSTTVTVVDVASKDMFPLSPNVSTTWNGYYLNSAEWSGNNTFMPTWKNRIENEAIVEQCNAPNFTCSHGSKMETNSGTGWVGHYKVSHIYPVPSSNKYLTVQSNNQYPHVALINVDTDEIDWRTTGSFEVTDTGYGYTSIYYYDETFDWVYFTSTEMVDSEGQGLPRIRHMWRVKGHGTDVKRTCITCTLNEDFKDRCNWVTPSFSKDGSFVVINCGGTANGVPVSTLHKRNDAGDFEFVRVAENNTALQSTLSDYYFRERIYGTIKLPDVDGDWYYTLHLPPNFDSNKKYPMLVQVYSGPAFQEVEERFSVSWKDYVSSSLNVIVMSFDGRGTGFRGDKIMHMVYKKLGQYEPADQIAAARIVSDENSYIDKSKTAIWGWSYGGYATSRVIGEDSENVYKCGFSVAPVTKWELYHTIYTERYMQEPKDNENGYSMSTALQNPENFAKHRYALFHGTRDENVHFQNSALLSKFLIKNDVDFRAFFAADDDHGMNRVPNNYRNIYKMLTNQMQICFDML